MATAVCVSNDEFWKECASWLTRWGILRIDHKANWENAAIGDLANTLRDGVLLCTLLSKMDPICIDMKDVNLKPALARFLCLRNIQLFLKICKTIFGLRDNDLFEETMLFDLVNFHKVLCTLSKLSLTPKALKSHILGFSIQDERTRGEEDIYQHLKTADLRQTCSGGIEPSWLQFTIPCPQLEDREEEVYDDLCYVTFSNHLPELHVLCVSDPPISDALDTVEYTYCDHDHEDTYQSLMQLRHESIEHVSKPMEKRDYVIKELIDTEKNYVEVLYKLKRNFMQKLESMLRPEHYRMIFLNIPQLHELHQAFYGQLQKLHEKPSHLSKVFIHYRENFLVYASYCSNLSSACNTLQDICNKDPEVCRRIEELEKQDNNGKFKLRDVLAVPMQRVLRYHLLLEKLIELTDSKHEEYNDLKEARDTMLDVASYVNEYTRDSEQLNVINQVRENITEWDCPFRLEQCGRLMKDGEIKIKPHDDGKLRTRYIFIFQKCMILCKPLKDNKFAYRDMFNLNDFRVDDINNRPTLNQNARWGYQWLLVKLDTSTAYTCFARTIELKNQMVKTLKDCMDNLKPMGSAKTTHKFELNTFDKPVACVSCSRFLKGLIFQGYKCRGCNAGAHKDCIITSGNCGLPPVSSSPHMISQADETLKDKLWFVGEMDRQKASTCLQNRRNGTYLVRVRPQCDEQDRYALSLKTDDTVKHMKICSNMDGSVQKFFLSPAKYFNSIEKLVENYQFCTLKESFERLQENTKLDFPYKQMKARALRDFDVTDVKHLPLKHGHEFIVICQEGYREGWWKGSSNVSGTMKVGYFPSKYVQVLEVLHDLS